LSIIEESSRNARSQTAIIEESSRNARSQTAISEAGSQEGHSTAAFFEGLLEPTRHRIRERALVTEIMEHRSHRQSAWVRDCKETFEFGEVDSQAN